MRIAPACICLAWERARRAWTNATLEIKDIHRPDYTATVNAKGIDFGCQNPNDRGACLCIDLRGGNRQPPFVCQLDHSLGQRARGL